MESPEIFETLQSFTDNSRLLSTQPTISGSGRCRLKCLTRLPRVSFVIFLLWQIAGSVLYFVRSYSCCIHHRKASFRCSNSTAFPHSQEYELAWLISLNAYIIVFVFFLTKIPGFLGFSVILRKAVRLPTFWTLSLLQVTQIIGFGIILKLNTLTLTQILLVINFCLLGIELVCIMCVLNFTAINCVKNSSGSFTYVLSKMVLMILFQQVFVIFAVGSVQFVFKVTGLDNLGRSADFVKVFRKLREFPQVIFFYKASSFLFRKIFMDNNNILSHSQLLKLNGNSDTQINNSV